MSCFYIIFQFYWNNIKLRKHWSRISSASLLFPVQGKIFEGVWSRGAHQEGQPGGSFLFLSLVFIYHQIKVLYILYILNIQGIFEVLSDLCGQRLYLDHRAEVSQLRSFSWIMQEYSMALLQHPPGCPAQEKSRHRKRSPLIPMMNQKPELRRTLSCISAKDTAAQKSLLVVCRTGKWI